MGPLYGGGLVLGYRCGSRCRHCLYGAGPKRRDGLFENDSDLDALLDELAQRGAHARYHIGGGEPFLDVELLRRAVSGLLERGLALEYVETNASWVRSAEQAQAALEELADVGLTCVLVSLSPFHAEYVPPQRTHVLIESARRVLPAGAFVWIPDFLPDISDFDSAHRIDLAGVLRARGDSYARGLASRYGLVPGGRAGRFLHRHGVRRQWRDVVGDASCARRLSDTSHFHVDGQGLFVPGLCAGVALPLHEVPGDVDVTNRPILSALVHGGVEALVQHALEWGFEPSATYSSACDLCCHVRAHLYVRGRGRDPLELGPDGFYEQFAFEAYGVRKP
jgi:hypothetical protein